MLPAVGAPKATIFINFRSPGP